MRLPVLLWCALLASPAAVADDANDRAALRQLFVDYNAAVAKHDRAALDAMFLSDYAWVHSTGTVNSRAVHLDRALANDPPTAAPVPDASAFELHGDMALLRTTARDGLYAITVFARDDDRWRFAHAQGTRLPPERKAVAIDPATLDRYVGSYEFAPGKVAVVTRNGDALTWKGGLRPPVTLMPLGGDRFFGRESEAEMLFSADDAGKVASVTLRLGSCLDSSATRVR